MELLDRYVQQVGRLLPGRDRDDIQNELRSLLQDQLDDRRAVSAEVSEEDVVALLKEMGSPREVAASYGGDRYLVGPELYPLLLQVLQIGLIVYVIVHIVLLVFGATVTALPDLIEFGSNFLGNILGFFGAVVVVFAILERQDVKLKEIETDWDPRTLPAIDEPGRVDMVGLFVGLAFNMIFLSFVAHFWRLGGVRIIMGTLSDTQILPLSRPLLMIVAGLVVLQILIDLYVFLQRRWQVSTRVVRTLLDVAAIYPIYLLLSAVISGVIADVVPFESLVPVAHQGLAVGMALAAAITLVDGAVKTYKLLPGVRTGIALG